MGSILSKKKDTISNTPINIQFIKPLINPINKPTNPSTLQNKLTIKTGWKYPIPEHKCFPIQSSICGGNCGYIALIVMLIGNKTVAKIIHDALEKKILSLKPQVLTLGFVPVNYLNYSRKHAYEYLLKVIKCRFNIDNNIENITFIDGKEYFYIDGYDYVTNFFAHLHCSDPKLFPYFKPDFKPDFKEFECKSNKIIDKNVCVKVETSFNIKLYFLQSLFTDLEVPFIFKDSNNTRFTINRKEEIKEENKIKKIIAINYDIHYSTDEIPLPIIELNPILTIYKFDPLNKTNNFIITNIKSGALRINSATNSLIDICNQVGHMISAYVNEDDINNVRFYNGWVNKIINVSSSIPINENPTINNKDIPVFTEVPHELLKANFDQSIYINSIPYIEGDLFIINNNFTNLRYYYFNSININDNTELSSKIIRKDIRIPYLKTINYNQSEYMYAFPNNHDLAILLSVEPQIKEQEAGSKYIKNKIHYQNKKYIVHINKNKNKYILCNKKKISLRDIRGKYRYV